MIPAWYRKRGGESFSPAGRDVDATLIAAGYVREESGIEYKAGFTKDLAICRANYVRGKDEKVFIITHEKGGQAPAPGGAA